MQENNPELESAEGEIPQFDVSEEKTTETESTDEKVSEPDLDVVVPPEPESVVDETLEPDTPEEKPVSEFMPATADDDVAEYKSQEREPESMSPNQSYKEPYSDEMPGEITTIGILTIISGAINITAGLGLSVSIVIGTIGLGLLCLPVLILPIVLGVFEIIFGYRLLTRSPQVTKPNKVLSILEICGVLYGNIISLTAGIVSLVLYETPKVKSYFERL